VVHSHPNNRSHGAVDCSHFILEVLYASGTGYTIIIIHMYMLST
jgi:hypothetical protein